MSDDLRALIDEAVWSGRGGATKLRGSQSEYASSRKLRAGIPRFRQEDEGRYRYGALTTGEPRRPRLTA